MRTVVCGIVLAILAATCAVITAGLIRYPLHASCRVQWTFGKSCDQVQSLLINQMKIWESADNCANGGEKCLYKYISSTVDMLTGTHETPVKHYIDDVSFNFKSTGEQSCNVEGFSRSQLWYAVLDYGTNYCNLHNLVEGAHLHVNDSNYSEDTRDAVCTQYSSADCEVY